MSFELASYLTSIDLPESAKARLRGRDIDIHIDEDADPAIPELQALRQSLELLTKPVVEKIRMNEFLDDIAIVDTVYKRTYRTIAGDEMPVYSPAVEKAFLNLSVIEETTRHMHELLEHGSKSAEKLRIRSALPLAFAKDNDAYLQQLQQGFTEWANELDAYEKKYAKHFDDEQADYMKAARSIARHAAQRCAEIEIGPEVKLAR